MKPAPRTSFASDPPETTLTRTALPIRVAHVSPELVLGSYSNVHISIYRATPSVELLKLDQRHHEALAATVGSTVVCTVSAFGIKLPDSDARDLASELVRKNARFVRAAATLTEGDGFWASAARSAVTAVFLLARQPYPSRVFADVMECGAWLSGYANAQPPAIRDAVRHLQVL